MTAESRKEWVKFILQVLGGVIVGIIIVSFTQKNDITYQEGKELKDKVILLDRTKADKTDVDQIKIDLRVEMDKQDKSIKDEFNSKLDIVITAQGTTNQLLRDMINQKNK